MQSRPQKAPLHLVVSCLLLIQVFLTGILFATASKDVKKLPVRYQQWFNRDAAYLITDEEKGAFLHLSTDEERDKFVEGMRTRCGSFGPTTMGPTSGRSTTM